MSMQVINPATGEMVREYEETTPEAVDAIIEGTHETFLEWRRTDFDQRALLMRRAAGILRERTDFYAALMTMEMGKTIVEARAETQKCAWVCDYYAENAESFLNREIVETDAKKSFVSYQPIGIVLAVMPWNFPLWQVFRFAAPALMAGNAGLLKHASNVPGCALAIEEVFREAGFPEDLFRTLLIGGSKVSRVIENPLVRAATLPGGQGRRDDQKDRAGARRERSLRDSRGRGSGGGSLCVRNQPLDQRRPELHRGKALHRGGAGSREIHPIVRRAHGRHEDGRPARRVDPARAAGPS